jgi:hypothetical protein
MFKYSLMMLTLVCPICTAEEPSLGNGIEPGKSVVFELTKEDKPASTKGAPQFLVGHMKLVPVYLKAGQKICY